MMRVTNTGACTLLSILLMASATWGATRLGSSGVVQGSAAHEVTVAATSSPSTVVHSVGQPAVGRCALPSTLAARLPGHTAGVGLGYSIAASVYGVFGAACPVGISGDTDGSGGISTADIIYLVNKIFRAGPDPIPCLAAGDVNCTGNISPADIIYLVNFVFKDLDPPCDICGMIPGVWACP